MNVTMILTGVDGYIIETSVHKDISYEEYETVKRILRRISNQSIIRRNNEDTDIDDEDRMGV